LPNTNGLLKGPFAMIVGSVVAAVITALGARVIQDGARLSSIEAELRSISAESDRRRPLIGQITELRNDLDEVKNRQEQSYGAYLPRLIDVEQNTESIGTHLNVLDERVQELERHTQFGGQR
jgi:chromosome segregation ATPase